jgi:hypothetical protein
MKHLISVVLLVSAVALSTVAQADDHSTLRVIRVDTSDTDAYVAQLRKGKAMMMKTAPKMQMRVWRSTFAGSDTGAIIVGLEHPGSLADFASAWEKTQNDKEMAAWLDGLSDLRKLVSDSLYQEIPL